MPMETAFRFLLPKGFGVIPYLAAVLWTAIGVLFSIGFSKMDEKESGDFNCKGAKIENINYVRGQCYGKYKERYYKSSFPVLLFVIINFSLAVMVYITYSLAIRRKFNRLSRGIRNCDPETQSRDQENALSEGYMLFIAYCCQLSTRIVFGVIFIILQTMLLYPLKLPSNFNCYLTNLTTQPRNSSDNAQHYTLYNCHNQRASKETHWLVGVVVVNGIFLAFNMIEGVYIFFRACSKRDFMQNSKFQTSHLYSFEEPQQLEEMIQLLRNIPHETQQQERTQQETDIPQELHQVEESNDHETNIPDVPSGPEQLLNLPLQEFIQNTKKMIKDDTHQPTQLLSLFPSPLGKGHPPKYLTLDQIYTNFVIVPDMADYEFTEDRQKNLQIYTRLGEKNETLRGPEDILNHEDKKILIVGRPGIGKTLSCTKILRDWASNKIFHKTPDNKIHFDFVFFVEFRKFKATTDLCLRELLILSTYFPTNELDDVVWNFILKNPQRVLLIFDGIDEFTLNSEISIGHIYESPYRNMVYEKMPLFALYVKLATGKLLYGAAIMTTTRPRAPSCIESITFNKTYEILGFSSEQVKEYVTKFAEEDKEAGDAVRRHITSNNNILSLCYVPASCFIICSSLFKMVKFSASTCPSLARLTDIYKRAVNIFYSRHDKELRNEHFTHKDFETNVLPTEEKEKLEKMAFKGIKEGIVKFKENEVNEMIDSTLFHHFPDHEYDPFNREEWFCFIHLTVQEFFAARYLVNNMSETDLRNFVSENIKEGKWQLVFQFLAGLMQDKDNLPSTIISDLLPVKTEEKQSAYYNEQWTENEEKKKTTCWPTSNEKDLAVTLIQCLNENSRMKEEAQRKLQQINFNCVNFIACHLTAVDCSSLVKVINVQQISHLDLSYNNIGPLGCFAICKLLKSSESQLSWLNLTHNQLTDEAAEYLAEAIHNNNCQLRKLNLTANNISHLGAQHLAKAINNNNCQIYTLDLTANDISHIGAQHLAEAINNNNCQLLALNLSYNNISHIGAQHLAEAINNNNNCQLRTLYLSHNKISDIGAQHLAEAINNNNCQLRTLNLSHNNISHIGAQHLAEAINNNNCQLHTLNLSHNNISDIGAQHLAKAINNNNCQLRTLNLWQNYLTDIGAGHLAKAINNNKCQLRTLNLSENKISDTGAQNLAKAISNKNCQLRTLNLSYNHAITSFGKQYARNLLSNSHFKCELIL